MNSNIDYKTIGLRIKNKRKELNLTQDQVSNQAHITPFYLSKIENGKVTPTLEILSILANILQTDFEYLLTGTSKLDDKYVDQRLSDISKNASKEQLELIIKIANAILEH